MAFSSIFRLSSRTLLSSSRNISSLSSLSSLSSSSLSSFSSSPLSPLSLSSVYHNQRFVHRSSIVQFESEIRHPSPPLPESLVPLDFQETLREDVDRIIAHLRSNQSHIPVIINGEYWPNTEETDEIISPHKTSRSLGRSSLADPSLVQDAIKASETAKKSWSQLSLQERGVIFTKAAQIFSADYRTRLMGALVLQQSKNFQQAQEDVCGAIDVMRNSVDAAIRFRDASSPLTETETVNHMVFRPLSGFVFASSPFYSLSLSLHTLVAPLLAGNTVLWQPPNEATLSSFLIYSALRDAGLPEGVLHVLPGGNDVLDSILSHKDLSAVSYAGTNDGLKNIQEKLSNVSPQKAPVVVANTGGIGTMVIHKSADIRRATVSMIRGAYEYAGQNHTSTSRVFVSRSLWSQMEKKLPSLYKELIFPKTGSPENVECFVNAVIDRRAFNACKDHIKDCQQWDNASVYLGGDTTPAVGFFVDPTVLLTEDPHHAILQNPPRGPIINLCIFEDDQYEYILQNCTSPSRLYSPEPINEISEESPDSSESSDSDSSDSDSSDSETEEREGEGEEREGEGEGEGEVEEVEETEEEREEREERERVEREEREERERREREEREERERIEREKKLRVPEGSKVVAIFASEREAIRMAREVLAEKDEISSLLINNKTNLSLKEEGSFPLLSSSAHTFSSLSQFTRPLLVSESFGAPTTVLHPHME